MSIMKWLFKRLWCFLSGHQWNCVDEFDPMVSNVPTFQCRRCGKREGL